MSTPEVDENELRAQLHAAYLESLWKCPTCHNTYETTVQACPNQKLDALIEEEVLTWPRKAQASAYTVRKHPLCGYTYTEDGQPAGTDSPLYPSVAEAEEAAWNLTDSTVVVHPECVHTSTPQP